MLISTRVVLVTIVSLVLGISWAPPLHAQDFSDVPTDYWAFNFIETLSEAGVTGGCGGSNYCPEDPVSRAQMAVFLERIINGSGFVPPPATGTVFADVGAGDFAAAFIEQLFADGITGGCGGGNFCPNDDVTRAQMAIFLLRAKYGSAYAPPPATGVFPDVPLGSFGDSWIEQLAAEGITSGCGGGNFCPGAPVTRAQMAVFLVRTGALVNQPPSATPINPVDTETDVALNVVVAAVFNQNVATGTVDDTSFKISQGDTDVAAAAVFVDETDVAKLSTHKTLPLLTDFTATLTSAIEDLSGNPLPETSWSFTSRDGTWLPTEDLVAQTAGAYAAAPSVAANAAGNVIAVWDQDNEIWANQYTIANGWSDPVRVGATNEGSARDAQVAIDADGNAVAVWEYRNTDFVTSILANRFDTGTGWGTPVVLASDPNQDAEQPQVAAANNGDAFVVWSQYDDDFWANVWARRYDAGSDSWGSPVQLDLADFTDDLFPQVAADANGNAFAIWQQYDDDTGFDNIRANRYEAGTGWTGSAPVDTTNDDDTFLPQIAMDDNGNAVAVWEQTYTDPVFGGFYETIWGNRFGPTTATRTYEYTGANFNVISGTRFQSTDSLTGSFTVDCGLAGGAGDCTSLPFADYTPAVTSCSFTASGSPDLTITCDDALPGYDLSFQTDANGVFSRYFFRFESSLEGGNGARITLSDGGGFSVARPGAAGGEGRVDYAPGTWAPPTTSAWGSPELIQAEIDDAFEPQVSMNAAGDAVAVWMQFDGFGQNIWSNRFGPTTGWAGAETVSTNVDSTQISEDPTRVTVDTNGHALVGWGQAPPFNNANIWTRRNVNGAGWRDPVLVEMNDASAAFGLDLAVDGYGNVTAVWDQFDGAQDSIFFNRLGGGGESGGRLISEIQFADSALAACVQAAAATFSWQFSQEATDLDCANLGVRSLIGLETFTHLRTLDLGGNSLEDVSIIDRFAALEEINLSNMPGLENIDSLVTRGQLTLVDLGGSGDGSLDCGIINELNASMVTVIEPASCRQRVADVVLPDAQLQACAVAAGVRERAKFVDELVVLDCNRDGAFNGIISDLTGVDVFPNLEAINVDRSSVSDLGPLAALANLKRIDASSSDVTNLAPLAAAPNLEVLTLKSVRGLYRPDLGEDPTGISILTTMPALKEAYLNEKDYCPAQPQCVTGAAQLDCQTLDALEASPDLEVFARPQACNMPLAEVLLEITDPALNECVQDTATNEGLTDTDGFTSLSCINSNIADLTGLERFGRLFSLFLGGNPIQDLTPVNGNRTLEILDVRGTNIVDFEALSDLVLLRDLSAFNNPGLIDISELLRMDRLGRINGLTGQLATVDLGDSGAPDIPCAQLDLLRDIVESNGGTFIPSAAFQLGNCSGGPPLPPEEGRIADVNADGADDLVLQFEAAQGSLLTPSWTTALGSPTNFVGGGSLPGFDTSIYSRARAIALADANAADDFDDLLLQLDSAIDDSVEIRVHYSDGAGGFSGNTGSIILPTGGIDNARAIAFTDVDNDGNADILVEQQVTLSADSFVEYYLYMGTGSGFSNSIFVARIDLSNGRPRIIALEDVNSDGLADLVYDIFSGRVAGGNKHCFDVRTFNPASGNFNGSFSGADCRPQSVSPRIFLDHASVADINASGRKELVVTFNNEGSFDRIGDLVHIVGVLTLNENGANATWNDFVSVFAEEAPQGELTEYRTVAVADVNDDRRADVVIESTDSNGNRRWITYLALTNPGSELFQRNAFFVSGDPALQAVGMLDYDGDAGSLPDMLFRRYDTVSETYGLYVATNNGTSLTSPTLWYQSATMPGIIGIEEDGLTNLANDTTELIAWASDIELHTVAQFSQIITERSISRGEQALNLLRNTQLDPSIAVKAGECVIAYGEADAGGADGVDGFNQYKAQAKFASLQCVVVTAGGRIKLTTQAVYGGCAATAGIAGVGAKCEVGSVAAMVKFDLSPPGLPDSLIVEGEVKGPNASSCAEITLTNLCAGAQASLADASVGLEVAGVGAATGVCAGCVGPKFQLGIEDGALSGTVGAALGLGFELDVSINPARTVKTFYTMGSTAFTYGEKGGKFLIFTAGPAVFDAAVDIGEGLAAGAEGAFTIAKTAAGDAVAFFDDVGAEAEIAFILFIDLETEFLEDIFDDLDNAAATGINEVSGFLYDAADTIASGVVSIWRSIF